MTQMIETDEDFLLEKELIEADPVALAIYNAVCAVPINDRVRPALFARIASEAVRSALMASLDYINRTCPVCSASPGQECVRNTGPRAGEQLGDIHYSRIPRHTAHDVEVVLGG